MNKNLLSTILVFIWVFGALSWWGVLRTTVKNRSTHKDDVFDKFVDEFVKYFRAEKKSLLNSRVSSQSHSPIYKSKDIDYTKDIKNTLGNRSRKIVVNMRTKKKNKQQLQYAWHLAQVVLSVINNKSKSKTNFRLEDPVIGGGADSYVFNLVCNNKKFVLKLGDIPEEELNIITNDYLIAEEIIPKCYAYFKTDILIKNTIHTLNGYIQEFSGTPLHEFLKVRRQGDPNFGLSPTNFRNLFYKLLKFQMHTKCFHGDLHLGNILVREHNKNSLSFRLIDFGRSVYMPDNCLNLRRVEHNLPLIKKMSDDQIKELLLSLMKNPEFGSKTYSYKSIDNKNKRPYVALKTNSTPVMSNFAAFRYVVAPSARNSNYVGIRSNTHKQLMKSLTSNHKSK